jgi:hypothetical protein
MLQALLVPEGPLQAAHAPPTQRPLVLPSAHAEPFGVHDTDASAGASEAESPPSELDDPSLASAPESSPPPELDELLLESAPESEPPLDEEDPSPASAPPPEPDELLLESAPESLPPLELPDELLELLELEEPDELEEEVEEPEEPPESSPPPLDVASPPSSPLPPGPVEPLPPHPFTPVTSPQPARALNATQPRSEPNRRMRSSHHNQARAAVPETRARVPTYTKYRRAQRPALFRGFPSPRRGH